MSDENGSNNTSKQKSKKETEKEQENCKRKCYKYKIEIQKKGLNMSKARYKSFNISRPGESFRDCVDMYMAYRRKLAEPIIKQEKVYSEIITKKQIRDTYNLLKDYGIEMDISEIPTTGTYGDLQRWRRKIIKDHLDEY